MKPVIFWLSFTCVFWVASSVPTNYPNSTPSDDVVLYEERQCPRDCVCDLSIGTARCRTIDHRLQGFSKSYIKTLIVHDKDRRNNIRLEAHIFKLLGLRYVNTIKIINTTISSINIHAFNGLPYLTTVELVSNGLHSIDPKLFMNNTRLKRVNLSHNPIKHAHEHLLVSDNIEEIVISDAQITHLNETSLSKLPSAIFVDLSYNKITSIAAHAFKKLYDLEELRLGHNNITKISPHWFTENRDFSILSLKSNPIRNASQLSCDSLETLDLSNCELTQIDVDTFSNVKNLIDLILTNNIIQRIAPDAFKTLTELYWLDLTNNLLTSLSEKIFYYNIELSTVHLSKNPHLKELPRNGFKFFYNTSSITLLDVAHCGLRRIEAHTFANMNSLTDLLLNNNKIAFIHAMAFTHLPALSQLDLSNNNLQAPDVMTFSKNTNLRRLNISNNPWKILNAETFSGLINLIWLDASYCQLKELWQQIPEEPSFNPGHRLINLNKLNVSHNDIVFVTTQQLSMMQKLKVFDIQDNPLQCDHMLTFMLNWLENHQVRSRDADGLPVPRRLKEKERDNQLIDASYWSKLGSVMCNGKAPPQFANRVIMKLSDHVERVELDKDIFEETFRLGLNSAVFKNNSEEDDYAENSRSDDDDDESDDDDADDDIDEEIEDENGDYGMDYEYDQSTKSYSKITKLASAEVKNLMIKHPYLTLILYLIGLLMSIVIITIFLIHFLRNPPSRKSDNIGITSTISGKPNSGLVYQPLSEEY